MDPTSQQGVCIVDKDETSDKAYHVIDGFVFEDNKNSFPQNGHLSFVPEDYGKASPAGPPPPKKPKTPQQSAHQPEDLPEGTYRCEFCGHVEKKEKFLPPSRRFCSLTCCKRYSAEKRYYPYGKDEEGIAQSIREGLLNPNRSTKHPRGGKQAREERRRRLAFYGCSTAGEAGPSVEHTTRRSRGRGRRGRRGRRHASPPAVTSRSGPTSLNFSIHEIYTHPYGIPLYEWSVEDVSEFLMYLGYEAYIDKFVEHEIDGRALGLIRDHHLLMTMKLRLGPTLKICEHISAIKSAEEVFED